MNIKQSLRMAIKSIMASKMRSFLTMLGIIIGVASVIILVSIMNGLSSDITSNLESAGTNTISVMITGRGGNRSFGVDDMDELVSENPEHFVTYSPMVTGQVSAKNGTASIDTSVTGVNELYARIKPPELSQGRFLQYIDVERLQKVCVIGSYIVEELFDGNVYEGSTLKINGSTYTVVGVLDEMSDSSAYSSDDIIYIPYTTATRLSGNASIGNWNLLAADVNEIDAAISVVRAKLYTIFGSEDAYRVTSLSQIIDMMNEITASMAAVLVGIAGISLVVGGIGIMNIMLVSVTERTREIGIRKAVGAKRRAIMSQFLIEAAATSAAGGIVGIALGVALALLMGSLLGVTAIPSVNAIALAFGVSVAIGVIFGYFPAGKASKLNPI
ncbi:MAG: ABC transporter permease, partial [Clostridiales Family XIII bacterium]|nr:ABC transporter permease [Clostridiales Family XIII bacterium]